MSTGSPYFLSKRGGGPRKAIGYRKRGYTRGKSALHKALSCTPGNYTFGSTASKVTGGGTGHAFQSTAWFLANAPFTNKLGLMSGADIAVLMASDISAIHAAGDVTGGTPPVYTYYRKFWVTKAHLLIRVVNGGSNPITVTGYPWVARKTSNVPVNTVLGTPAFLESNAAAIPTGLEEQQLGVTPFQFKYITEFAHIKKPRSFKLYGGQSKTINMTWSGKFLVDDITLTSGVYGGITRGVMLTARGDPAMQAGPSYSSAAIAEMIVSSTTAYSYCVETFPVHVHDYVLLDTVATSGLQQIVPQTGAVGAIVYL